MVVGCLTYLHPWCYRTMFGFAIAERWSASGHFFKTFTRIKQKQKREVKRSGGLRSCLIREFWICVVRDWPSSRQRIRASFASVLCLSWRIVPQCILLCFAFRSRWTQQTSLWSLVFKSTQYTTQYQVCIRTHCAAPT